MPRTSRPADGAIDPPKTRRKASNGANGPGNGVSDDEVARRAYEIYQNRGASDGTDLDDWFEAERQLKPGTSRVTGRAAASRKRKVSEETGV